jgi:xyloglucan-specific exo-beta-1,4-glucanase
MKHLFTKLAFCFFFSFGFLIQAQVSFEATDEFGRIENISFDPVIQNKLYAVTRGNHIITSNDKGQTWEVFYSFEENDLELRDLKFINHDKLSFKTYFTPTAQGVYILDIATQTIEKSFTVPITPGTTSHWIESYDIYEANTDIALLHQGYKIGMTSYAKVYYTTDGGNNWNLVYYNVDWDYVFPNNVAISPNNPSKLFIARSAGSENVDGGLMVSNWAGAAWTEHMPGITFDAIAFHPNNPDEILLGTSLSYMNQVQNLYRSIDGGDSWEIIDIDWTDHPVYVGASKTIKKIIYNPSDYNNILILDGNEIAITNDNGDTWSNYVYPMYDETVYMYGSHASFNPFQSNEVFINADHYPMFSNDGGATLDFLRVPFCDVNMAGTFVGNEEHLYYSILGGIIHKNLTTGVENIYNTISIIDYTDNDKTYYFKDQFTEGRIFAYHGAFLGSELKVSTDHGATFTTIQSGSFDALRSIVPDPNNSNKIWVSYAINGVIVYDIQDLNNIQVTYIDIPEYEEVNHIYINPSNSDEVIITLKEDVYRSLDSGVTWDLINNGMNIGGNDFLYALDVNPFNPNEMVASSTVGIFKTVDGGNNWVLSYPMYNVTDIKYSPETPGHIVAATFSAGLNHASILYSENGGDVWNQVPVENIYFTGTYAMDFRFYADAVDVYIASLDLGLLKYHLELSTLSTPTIPNQANDNIIVYPNPASDKIFIENLNIPVVEVRIYATNGELITKSDNPESGIDISQLRDGIYIVMVNTSNNQFSVKKLVKN